MAVFAPATIPARDRNGTILGNAMWSFFYRNSLTPADVVGAVDTVTADSNGDFADITLETDITYRAVLKDADGKVICDIGAVLDNHFSPAIKQAFNDNGQLVAGATWSFYLVGTTTPATVYADEATTIARGSVVQANGAGRFPLIYLDEAVTYKAVLRDADGNELQTIDPVDENSMLINLSKTAIYVDSVGGSNSNDGLSPTTPKQTLAAAVALLADDYALMLKCDSVWYETLDLVARNNVAIATYSTGAAPIIDGAAVLSGTWTQPNAGTYPNLWQISHTHAFDNNQSQLPVMKNGVQLIKKTTDADVNSTAGSYSSASDEALASNNPAILKIYAAANPNTDGNVYTVPARMNVLTNAYGTTGGLIVAGVQTQNQGSNDGSAIFGDNSTISRCLFRNGHKHNALIESGTITDFAVLDATDVGGIGVVLFSPDGAGKSGTFTRGMFLGRIGQTTTINNNGFYAHTSGTQHDSFTLEQCYFKGYGAAITGIAGAATLDGCYIRNAPMFSVNTGTTTIRYMQALVDSYGGNASSFLTAGTHVMSDCVDYSAASGQEHIRLNEAHTSVSFVRCSFFDEIGASRNLVGGLGGLGTSPVTFDHCVFWGSQQLPVSFTTSPVLTADFNVYYKAANGGSTNAAMAYGNVTYTSLGAWQTATGEDANSVYCRPTDQVAGGQYAFWLAWKEAAGGTDLETVGPAVGDFRINPGARVYGGDETAYIGTFADGTTPITDAGQQTHWDWNERTTATGPATAWPTTPATLAQAQTYIAAPRAWEF